MARNQETEILDNSDDADEVVPVKYEITSYGADFLVDGLVRRLKDGSIFMPLFQRGFVWTYTQASRFIESLLLGLPVPGIFLSKEYETQKLLVIDGQQRLRTLQYFYEGIFPDSGKEFALSGVQPQFDSLTYKRLKDEDRRQLDNSILHATIVQVSGFLDTSVRAIYSQYAQDKSAPNVANYVTRRLDGFQNPNMTKIISLTNSFNKEWGVSLDEQTKGQLKNAIDSICANRNLIAHGRDSGITYARINDWYQDAIEVVELIEKQCEDG